MATDLTEQLQAANERISELLRFNNEFEERARVAERLNRINILIATRLQRSLERNGRLLDALHVAKAQLKNLGNALSAATGSDELHANTTDFYQAIKQIDDAIENNWTPPDEGSAR